MSVDKCGHGVSLDCHCLACEGLYRGLDRERSLALECDQLREALRLKGEAQRQTQDAFAEYRATNARLSVAFERLTRAEPFDKIREEFQAEMRAAFEFNERPDLAVIREAIEYLDDDDDPDQPKINILAALRERFGEAK